METILVALGVGSAVVAALAAVAAILVEQSRSQFSHGIDILMKLSDEFYAEPTQKRGVELARLIQQRRARPLSAEEDDRRVALASDFLGHFEALGFLLRKHALDRQLIYVYFFYRFHGFWPFLQEVILQARPEYPMLWVDAEWLHAQLLKVARSHQPREYLELTEAYKVKFIDEMAKGAGG